jgi:putative transposase
MHRTWKYRLYPAAAQARELERQLAVACDLYNAALEQRIWAWRSRGVSIAFREQSKQLTEARHELPWLIGMSSLAQHGVLRRLDRAFQAFYRRVGAGQAPGFPRFKPRAVSVLSRGRTAATEPSSWTSASGTAESR